MNIRTFLKQTKKIPYQVSAIVLITILFVIPLPVGSHINPSNIFPVTFTKVNSNDIIYSSLCGIEEIENIRRLSNEYNVDYRLIVAIIKHESRFNSEAVSERGAIGLMQIMPVTNNEIEEELRLENTSLLKDHLRAGIYYFAKLLGFFENCKDEDRISLALAAYNAGPSRIYDAQELAAYLGEVPTKWSSVRNTLPLLSKRYYSLHRIVWDESKPPNGYYGSWKQTQMYVENIMQTYNEFKNPSS